jgi:hypothetical protein
MRCDNAARMNYRVSRGILLCSASDEKAHAPDDR